MRAFAQAEKFVSEVEGRKLRPVYVFIGDEAFFRKKCRDAILRSLVPDDLREFSLYEFDLAETDLAEILDRARTPSLMAPFQVFFVRGVKHLFGRGSNEDKLNSIEAYAKDPNPDAVLIFVADHISIPADVRRMDLTDKERYERIREAMGKYAAIIELGRVEEGDAVRWIQEHCGTREAKIDPDAARELVDSLGGDMMMISNELEKLMLYVGEKKRITLGRVIRIDIAAKSDHGVFDEYWPTIELNPIASVKRFGSVRKVQASTNSVQAAMKPNRTVIAIAGRTSGSTTSMNARFGPAPSISADSSTSRGIVSM